MTGMYGNSAARDVLAELLKERNQYACQLVGFGGKKSCNGMCEDNGMIYYMCDINFFVLLCVGYRQCRVYKAEGRTTIYVAVLLLQAKHTL